MTYEVKGEPTAYFLAECFQTMIEGLVSCVNQREHQQRDFCNDVKYQRDNQKVATIVMQVPISFQKVTRVIQIPQILLRQ